MIPVLSRIYTETLGGWALWLFYVGAVVTLYGTIFASTAAHARVFADLVRMVGGYARADGAARGRWRDVFIVVLATLPAIFYWLFGSPVQMVVAGGLAQALMLPLIGLAAIYLRHRHVPTRSQPSPLTTAALWLSAIVMWPWRRPVSTRPRTLRALTRVGCTDGRHTLHGLASASFANRPRSFSARSCSSSSASASWRRSC